MQFLRPVLVITLLSLLAEAHGQADSTAPAPKQPLRLFSWSDPHSATKASIYSAVIPGLGQAYNRKYWKMPLVYASMGAATWFMLDQRSKMRDLNMRFEQDRKSVV